MTSLTSVTSLSALVISASTVSRNACNFFSCIFLCAAVSSRGWCTVFSITSASSAYRYTSRHTCAKSCNYSAITMLVACEQRNRNNHNNNYTRLERESWIFSWPWSTFCLVYYVKESVETSVDNWPSINLVFVSQSLGTRDKGADVGGSSCQATFLGHQLKCETLAFISPVRKWNFV